VEKVFVTEFVSDESESTLAENLRYCSAFHVQILSSSMLQTFRLHACQMAQATARMVSS
jgi:hypothetical protein